MQYEEDILKGKKLSEQQMEARYCIGEVDTQLEFIKEAGKILASLLKEYNRSCKQREESLKKEVYVSLDCTIEKEKKAVIYT